MGAMGALALSSTFQASNSLLSAYQQAGALREQGRYQQQQLEFNARISELQAEDATARGDREAGAARRVGKQVRGAQRAALAAQGVDVNSGSAADVQDETTQLAEADAQTIRANAWREAWGFRAQAQQARGQGRMGMLAANNQARSTILTGGLQAIGYGLQAGAFAYGMGKDGGALRGRVTRGKNALDYWKR